MPAWPGGKCPECGDEMPARLVHCQNCGALLNPELETDTVEIPAFVPLQEIATMVEVEPKGYYADCPDCGKELRIAAKYVGQRVACKFCDKPFKLLLGSPDLTVSWFYADCHECGEELRVANKYIGEKVACKHCNAKIHFVEAVGKSS